MTLMGRTRRQRLLVVNHLAVAAVAPRGWRLPLVVVCVWALLMSAGSARATPVVLNGSYAGYINFVTTGGTLRTQADGVDPCAVTTGPVAATLSGIPAGSTIARAFLYWGGSGLTNDTTVTLDGSGVTVARSFSDFYSQGSFNNLSYFGNVADVTNIVSVKGNGSYSFDGLTVTNTNGGGAGETYCQSAAVAAGWGLFVIYENATTEPLRVINVYDGLQAFRGSDVTQMPANFKIPVTPVDGKMAILSLEGDVDNSGALNGFNEALTFNASVLTDALNPANNQFNSTVNVLGSSTTYGFDYDEYNITPYLSAGMTSATTVYSTGDDLALLMLQGVSVTSVPVSDVYIQKTAAGNLVQNRPGRYLIHVGNNGPLATATNIAVSDTLDSSLTYTGFSGTGWSCSAASQVVTCTYTASIAVGALAPDLYINVNVADGTLGNTIANTATVSGGNTFDNISANNTSSVSKTVVNPSLSTSVKSVIDLNGGDVVPGDTLRYRIDVIESNGGYVNGITVTDNIPANLTGFTVVTIPAGATNSSSSAPAGSNGTGLLNITGINVPANGTVSIEFDAVVAAGTPVGTVIANTAAITPAAPLASLALNVSVSSTVLASSVPVTGTKNLYFYLTGATVVTVDGSTVANANTLSRRVPTATTTTNIASVGGTTTLIQTPVLQKALTLTAGNIPIYACMNRGANSLTRTVTAALSYWNGSTFVAIGTAAAFPTFNSTTYALYNTNVNLAANVTIPVGGYLRAVITNTTGTASRSINVTTNNANCGAGVYSRVALNAATVINVDSVDAYDAAYAGGTLQGSASAGQVLYARAVISDPFGSFDINSASFQLLNSSSVVVSGPTPMSQVAFSAANGTRTWEVAFTVPAATGSPYTLHVTSQEGTEGTISDLGVGGLIVLSAVPVLAVTKTAVPAATVAPGGTVTYSAGIANNGTGVATNVALLDSLSLFTAFGLNTYGAGVPFQLVQGAPSSTLTLGAPVYSNDGGTTYTYTPVSGAGGAPAGYDGNVTHFRLPMTGTMPAGSSFTINYGVILK